jgi:hypothetical protein
MPNRRSSRPWRRPREPIGKARGDRLHALPRARPPSLRPFGFVHCLPGVNDPRPLEPRRTTLVVTRRPPCSAADPDLERPAGRRPPSAPAETAPSAPEVLPAAGGRRRAGHCALAVPARHRRARRSGAPGPGSDSRRLTPRVGPGAGRRASGAPHEARAQLGRRAGGERGSAGRALRAREPPRAAGLSPGGDSAGERARASPRAARAGRGGRPPSSPSDASASRGPADTSWTGRGPGRLARARAPRTSAATPRSGGAGQREGGGPRAARGAHRGARARGLEQGPRAPPARPRLDLEGS